jgi:hypothetical protein
MNVASALPQNSVFLSGGMLPPSKSATATVAAEANGVRVHAKAAGATVAGIGAAAEVEAGADAIGAATDAAGRDGGLAAVHAAIAAAIEIAAKPRMMRPAIESRSNARAKGANFMWTRFSENRGGQRRASAFISTQLISPPHAE